jgi:hypothetical protein
MKNLPFNTALIFMVLLLEPIAFPATAQAQSLGNILCSASFNLAPFESLFVGLSYITGAIMIGTGMYELSYFTDSMNSPQARSIGRTKGHLIAGACLLALPAFIRLLINTFFNFSFHSDFGGGLSACVPVAESAGVGNGFANPIPIDSMVINMVHDIRSPAIFMLSVLSILIGIFLIIRGLLKASKFGQDRTTSTLFILADVFTGTMLYTVGTSMDSVMTAIFGDGTMGSSAIATSNIAGNGDGSAVTASLTFVQVIGIIMFIRGWMILADPVGTIGGKNEKKMLVGFSHLLCGALAVNIYRFLDVMNATFSP